MNSRHTFRAFGSTWAAIAILAAGYCVPSAVALYANDGTADQPVAAAEVGKSGAERSPARPGDTRLAPGTISNLAYPELTTRVEANQNNFYVYLDEDSGLNHGFPSGSFSGFGAALVMIDPGCIDDPNDTTTGCYASGDTTVLDETHGTVFRVTFPVETGDQYTGLNIEEPQNWGVLNANGECGVTTTCNPYDLTGATTVEFDVRSPDGMTLQFGVGSQPLGGCATAPTTLPASTTYTHMSLTLGPPMLSCTPVLSSVNVLFFVVTSASMAPNGGTVLIDNIQFTKVPARSNQGSETLSLPLSTTTYGVVPQIPTTTVPAPPDQVNRNVASVYESSLTVMSLLDRGQAADLTNAQEIANALDYALYHDNHGDFIPTSPGASAGCYTGNSAQQCGLHNAYDSGDIGLLNNQAPPAAGVAGDVRLAGFTVPPTNNGQPGFDLVLDGATGGNNAFGMLALLAAYKQFGSMTYLNDASVIANWLAGLADTSGTGYGGYFLGYPDMGMAKVLQTNKSTENNADIFAAFNLLAEIETGLGNGTLAAQWTADANVAGSFVLAMYDPVNGRFNTGTVPNGTLAGPGVCPDQSTLKGNDVINTCDFLDADSFPILAMGGSQTYGLYSATKGDWQPPMQYILDLSGPDTFTQSITANNLPFSGFDLVPAPPATGIAWEFTGQSVQTCNYLDAIFAVSTFSSCAQTYISQIAQAQTSAPFADGEGVVDATLNGENNPPNNLPPEDECLPTPFQCIAERVGLAATNWAIYSDLVVNPLSFFPQAILSATTMTFPTELVGSSSKGMTVTLTNTGSMALQISSITLSGTNGSDFSQTNSCGASVAAGASCSVTVTFKPRAKGTRTATLTISDNAPEGSQSITLTGTGTVVRLSPGMLNFGSVAVGHSSTPKTVTLTNTGNARLSFTGTGISITGKNPGDFTQTNTCGTGVAAHASCTITVTFTPKAKGSRSATVSVSDNGGGSPQGVPLTGTGM